jgi:hypothetical protein
MFIRLAVAVAGLLIASFLEGCGGGSASTAAFQARNVTYAVFATGNTCASIDFRTGGFTDGFDSSQGSYASTKQNSNGNLGTNGNLLNEGALTVNGSLSMIAPWRIRTRCRAILNSAASVIPDVSRVSANVVAKDRSSTGSATRRRTEQCQYRGVIFGFLLTFRTWRSPRA